MPEINLLRKAIHRIQCRLGWHSPHVKTTFTLAPDGRVTDYDEVCSWCEKGPLDA